MIGRRPTKHKPIVPLFDALDLKLLARFDSVLPPDFSRQHNLTLAGNGGEHASKIASYLSVVKLPNRARLFGATRSQRQACQRFLCFLGFTGHQRSGAENIENMAG